MLRYHTLLLSDLSTLMMLSKAGLSALFKCIIQLSSGVHMNNLHLATRGTLCL